MPLTRKEDLERFATWEDINQEGIVVANVPLVWKGRQIGVALRSKARSNPLYISTGHRISLELAVDWVAQCLTKYRLPEPTRQAHLAANAFRRQSLPLMEE